MKVRGFRVEPGEVETALASLAGVRACAVTTRKNAGGENMLVGYVVGDVRVDELRASLRKTMPEYLVPAAFVVLDALPLTPSGKVDRKALPAPDEAAPSAAYVAPLDGVEHAVATVFAEALGIGRVGATDDFLDLGGHSLLAASVTARVQRSLGVALPIRALFEARTPRAIAGLVASLARTDVLGPIPHADRSAPLPLTPQEARLWFLQRLDPDAATYNEVGALRLPRRLDHGALSRAFARLEERHEALRTRYEDRGDGPVRIVDQAGAAPAVTRLVAQDHAEAELQLRDLARAPYDLAREKPWRPAVVDVAEDEQIVAIAMHHIVTDEWSLHVLLRDLADLYVAERDGAAAVLVERSRDYADWAAHRAEHAPAIDAAVAHFAARLAGVEPIDLPTDHPRPLQQRFEGRKARFQLPRSVRDAVSELAKQEGTTLVVALLAALATVLHRYTRTERFAVAMPIAGRSRVDLDGVVGFFVETVAIDFDFSDRPTLRELLRRTREAALDAHAHAAAPYERVVDAVVRGRDLSRPPLCQVIFAPQPPEANIASFAGVPARRFGVDVGVAKFDLALYSIDGQEGVDFALEYATSLFEAETAHRIGEHYLQLLHSAVGRPDDRVMALSMMSEAEKQRVLFEWNATARPLPPVARIDALFREQALRHPNRVALAMGGTKMTYRELEGQSSSLARRLRDAGVGPEVSVGISTTRSFELVVGLIAILKAGGAYVPLDPSYPAERIALLARDAQVRCVLDPKGEITLPEGITRVKHDGSSAADDGVLDRSGVDAAYVLFTSGSTGKPKGVCVEHTAVVRLVRETDFATFGPDEVFLMYAPLAFDASTLEIWGPLLNGAKLVIAPPGVLDVDALAAIVERQGITFLWLTSALFQQFVDHRVEALRGVRQLITGGDVTSVAHADRVLRSAPGVRLVNGYGPTENTTFTTCHPITNAEGSKPIPIGKPIANSTAYVFDELMNPTPIGVAGELYAGGLGVARGYFARPDLTAEKFVADPFSPGGRLYRTGDLARWLPDGTIEFLGRKDHQVKVRGFRIELAEIETALRGFSAIEEVVVVARQDAAGDKRLVAYVVWRERLPVEAARAHLRETLPDYMIPSAFVSLESLPLTSSGKVDRKALPAPDLATSAAEYVAPRDATEEKLVEIFHEVLRVERVGVHDDFFALGGHSLLATRVISRLRSALEVELPVRVLFEAPTVARLAERVRAASAATAGPLLERVDRGESILASFAQTRLWFLDQLEGGGHATYNVPEIVRVEGPVDADLLERAVQELVARHETLRTTFVAIDGDPRQLIHARMELRLARVDASSEGEARAIVSREVHAPFDLAFGPLLRATLVRLSADTHLFVLNIHHIATDGWSNAILTRELWSAYAALSDGKPSPAPARAVDYADFAVWQRSWLEGSALERQLAFWKAHLAGAPAALELPTDRPRPPSKQHVGGTVDFELSPFVTEAVRALCRRAGATPFMVLLAAYQVVLSRWSGEKDIVVGTPIANRTRQELEGVVGFFVNTLALRTRIEPDASFTDVLERMKTTALSAYAHQDVPFEKLVEELKAARDLSRTPIFQAMFVLQNVEDARVRVPGVTLHREDAGLGVAKFDLTLTLEEGDETLRGSLEYDVALFDRSTIERFADLFDTFLDAAVKDPDARVSRLPLMRRAARDRVLLEWNATARPFDETPVHRIVAAQAARAPDAAALVSGETTVTYGELDQRANALAAYLRRRGVGPEDRVATWFRRSPEMMVAELAVLKAGAAYVPIDPAYPAARVAYTIVDSGAKLVLTTTDVVATVDAPDVPTEVIVLDEPAMRERLARQSVEDLDVPCTNRQAAYVLYTSGTTGKPKGSVIEHRCLSNVVAHTIAMKGLGAGERHSQIFGPAFDATTSEIWPTLCSGATLCFVSDEIRQSPAALVRWLREAEITFSDMPTALGEAVFDEDWTGARVRMVVLGGEALRRRPPAGFPRVRNEYGPTETTDYVTVDEVVPGNEPVTSIGRPISNVSIVILDSEGEPTPIGVFGEIHVGGASVGRGYFARPALTAEKFVPDPFSSEPGARLYRTGDRGRWRPDGRIEFGGRNDDQIKIRGFRVELGEIETALGAIAGVEKAVVVAREDSPGEKRLVAYFVGDAPVDVVTAQLRRSLPDYMIPRAFVVLASFPLTPNGKVDRKALPAPDLTASAAEYSAPRNDTEETLAGIFRVVLGVERIGVNDDFFALGGHSLLATRVISRLRSALRIELLVRALFERPTVASLAAHLAALGPASHEPVVSRLPRNEDVAQITLEVGEI